MTPGTFFELMLQDKENNPALSGYYKFLGSQHNFQFRKNHFLSRLHYIDETLIKKYTPGETVWDCGCGFGTTALFLAMNNIPVHGTTLEFYYETLEKRLSFWQQHGDVSLFSHSYENLFDPESPLEQKRFDWIVVQDTLHHLEPIDQALTIMNNRLSAGGTIVVLEENGNNIIQNAILYKRRGNKKIIDIWDEKLKKYITIGNENIRSLKTWQRLFLENGLSIHNESVRYTRYYLPFHYKILSPETLPYKETRIQSNSKLRKEYLFFGLNFTAGKIA